MKVVTKTINKLNELKPACDRIFDFVNLMYEDGISSGAMCEIQESLTRTVYTIIAQDLFGFDSCSDLENMNDKDLDDEIYHYCTDFVNNKSFTAEDLLENINKIMEEN